MRILVTLGGTSERIDQVREITNQSTGKLGCLIVEQFLQQEVFVDAIVTTYAKQPTAHPHLTTHLIHDTNELVQTLTTLLTTHQYDAVIHSMAISDFTTQTSLSEEAMLTAMNTWITTHPNEPFDHTWFQTLPEQTETKISSATDYLTVVLKKTPKVIQLMKHYQPHTLLVGFKLLVGVPTTELLAVAKQALIKNQADFVLANDLQQISGEQHVGYLINEYGICGKAESKQAIAQLIQSTIFPLLEERRS